MEIFCRQCAKQCSARSNWIFHLILQESYTYKDPITEFVECLYVNFDFDGAQKKLRECESVSMNFYYAAYILKFLDVVLKELK